MFGKKKKKEELEIVEATDNIALEEEKPVEPEIVDEKPKKQNPFKNVGFVFKIFASAVLLALGLWLIFDKGTAEKIIVTLSGAAIAILCLARVIYLIRAKDLTKKYKLIILIEIGLDLAVGVFLLLAGFYYQKDNETKKKLVKFIRENYRWFVGAVFYLRGAVHFYETAFLKGKSSHLNYVVNIALISLGTICFAHKFNVGDLRWAIIVLVLMSFAYLTIDGIRTYVSFKMGGSNGEKKKSKKDTVEEAKIDEIPAGILDKEEANQTIVN